MITVRVPLRISFLGGGTDYPSWYREHGGRVLATTIDKHVYVSLRKLPRLFQHRMRAVYSDVEHKQTTAALKHPVFREVFRYVDIVEDIEAYYHADLPERRGMGSSSALVVGLLHAIASFRGSTMSPMQIAREAIHVEQNIIGDVVGCQDQIITAHGGFNLIEFGRDECISITPAVIGDYCRKALEQSIMLVDTGSPRHASEIAKTYALRPDQRQRGILQTLSDMVNAGYNCLKGDDIERFGHLLDEAWSLKRQLSPIVSSDRIDALYRTAKRAGAWGGKLLGAGSGGFFLLVVHPERQADVREALQNIIEIPVRFESEGSMIIGYQPDRKPTHSLS